MSLTEKDLRAIKDIVDFSIEKSEIRMDEKLEKLEENIDRKIDKKLVEVIAKIDREVSDIAEMNREFLVKLDNHENRIGRLELQTSVSVK